MYDANTTIDQFLTAAAARKPTPGGGSVTALVGALAASMGEMVINYSIGKKGLEPYEGELRPAVAELTRARHVLLLLMSEDQTAYEAVAALRKLPADSPERAEQQPAALLAAIRVPQAIAATAIAILELTDKVVNFVNYHLLSDLAVCADLAMATARCAIYNVRVNIAEIPDPADRRAIESSIGQLMSHAAVLIQQVSPRIWARHSQGV
jgi:glutamate formiminotransferase/formiminotetrahydrofolate cyclodeaminase